MTKTISPAGYVCNVCGATASSWAGRCAQCGEWNTLEIQAVKTSSGYNSVLEPVSLAQGKKVEEQRLVSGIAGIDDVFGGGIVRGSVNLLSGEPGMGKSTLLLQLATAVADNQAVLYVSGEESLHQIGSRASRLLLTADQLKLAASNSAEEIIAALNSKQYQLVVIDSIQTISSSALGSSPGSISQVTNCASLLASAAKQSNTAIIIVSHVTKEGNIAGPKLMEHIVDVVLSLEGDQTGGLKLLRSLKNRYGSTNETGIFEMKNTGLVPVVNPSAVLLAERQITDGSIVLATIEGSRPILVEVQALVNTTGYGYPKRAVSGFDLGRLNLLVAMLERRTTLRLSDKDIYVNIVGGLKVTEPAADLAIVMAIASAARHKTLKDNAVVFGEIGLSGEIRHVNFIDKRITEAKKLGFDYAICPAMSSKSAFLHAVKDVRSILNSYLS